MYSKYGFEFANWKSRARDRPQSRIRERFITEIDYVWSNLRSYAYTYVLTFHNKSATYHSKYWLL